MKKQLGQFFTTNADYILQGFEKFIINKNITDPFAGNADLIKWAKKGRCKKIVGYDIDKKHIDNKIIYHNDSINNQSEYKFILTNPPYLHKNKADAKTKELFFSGKNILFEDLYQVSINAIMDSDEGIMIVPLNFLSASNSLRIRKLFFAKFKIKALNIFLEQVFEDTTYNVISFYYHKKERLNDELNSIKATIYPQNKKIKIILRKNYNWQFGGEFIVKLNKTKNNLGIYRLTEKDLLIGANEALLAIQNIKDVRKFSIEKKLRQKIKRNILFLRAIDSKNGKKIQLEDIRKYNIDGLVGKNTSRNMAHLIFKMDLDIKEQEELMSHFNKELEKNRRKYFSFFLTNFRDNNRKRISFELVYKFLNYIYYAKHSKQSALF